jgi:meiotic recombination protein SPO11
VRRAAEVNAAIQDCVALLSVPRVCLGVTCASRGAVAGRLHLKEDNAWRDLGATQRGHAIPGDMAWVANAALRSDAAYILVVEKDAVFNRLLQERACERLGAVMLTARGQPDLASRAMLARLAALRPDAPVLGLVDWNPSGLLILSTFKLGSLRMGLEAGHYNVNVRWLGARAADLAGHADEDLLPLTPRDEVLLRNLLAAPRFGAAGPAYAAELRAMAARGRKAELEALYSADAASSLTDLLLPKILRADYI